MAVKQKCPECKKGAPAWVVTYGDLMSLLMTFFVLLLSFATMEKPKEFNEFAFSIRSSFAGVMPKNLTITQINPMPVRMKSMPDDAEEAARKIKRALQVKGKSDAVRVEYDKSGALKITLPNRVLYDAGQAQLRPDAEPFLIGIGEVLAGFPDAFFEIHGHTDNVPLTSQTRYRDNKDLSYARADAVMRFISRSATIPIEHFEAVAHGAGKPSEPNNSAKGRLANRRVEIYIQGLLTDQEIEQLKQRVDVLANQ